MTPVEEQEHRRPHEKDFFIPAGALIGFGAGLIAGYLAPGILIGLGLGFLARAFFRQTGRPAQESSPPASGNGNRWISVVIGVFMIVIGIGLVWSPADFWPYIIGFFLILLGIMVAVKSLGKCT